MNQDSEARRHQGEAGQPDTCLARTAAPGPFPLYGQPPRHTRHSWAAFCVPSWARCSRVPQPPGDLLVSPLSRSLRAASCLPGEVPAGDAPRWDLAAAQLSISGPRLQLQDLVLSQHFNREVVLIQRHRTKRHQTGAEHAQPFPCALNPTTCLRLGRTLSTPSARAAHSGHHLCAHR